MNEKDFFAFRFCLFLLEQRIRNSGYPEVKSGIEICRNPHGYLEIPSSQPATTARELHQLLQSLAESGFGESEAEEHRESFISRYFYLLQDPGNLCLEAGRQICAGNLSPQFLQASQIRTLEKKDLDVAFKEGLKNPSWTFAGDTSGFSFPVLNLK